MNYKVFLAIGYISFCFIALVISSHTDWGIGSKIVNGIRKYYRNPYADWEEQDYSPGVILIAIIIAILIVAGYYFFKNN